MTSAHKRASTSGLDEEGGIRKKLKVECEVQEDGTCEIRDTDETADITLEGEILVGMVSIWCDVTCTVSYCNSLPMLLFFFRSNILKAGTSTSFLRLYEFV